MYLIGTAIIHICGFSFTRAADKGVVRPFTDTRKSMSAAFGR
jgi:hypothetical protein